MKTDTADLIRRYYDAFTAGDIDGFLDLLTDNVVHDINQGGREIGRDAFRRFLDRMNRSYREQISDLAVMTNEQGDRAAAEFTVLGAYLATDEGLPAARPTACQPAPSSRCATARSRASAITTT